MQQIQIGLLPAGFRILTAVAHHGTRGGESAAFVGIDLSYLNHVIDAFLIKLGFQFGYIFLQCDCPGGIRIGLGKLTLQRKLPC